MSTKEDRQSKRITEGTSPEDVIAIYEYPNGARQLWYWCAGCESHHALPQHGTPHVPEWPNNADWIFDGNLISPTLSPSVNSPGVCHHYVRKGHIEYLADSSHALKGQTIKMQPIALTHGATA